MRIFNIKNDFKKKNNAKMQCIKFFKLKLLQMFKSSKTMQ